MNLIGKVKGEMIDGIGRRHTVTSNSIAFKNWTIGRFQHRNLSNRIHLEELRSFCGDKHLEIRGQFQFDATVLCRDETLVNIFVSSGCVQDLHRNQCIKFSFMLNWQNTGLVIWGNGKVESRKETDQSHFLS